MEFRSRLYYNSILREDSNRRGLYRRNRAQGPYKIILTSNDIVLGPTPAPPVVGNLHKNKVK